MAMTNAEKTKAYRERQKEKKFAQTAAQRQAAYMARLKDKDAASRLTAAIEKRKQFAALILQAQAIAAEIHAEEIAALKSLPLSRETAVALHEIEGREMRLSFSKI